MSAWASEKEKTLLGGVHTNQGSLPGPRPERPEGEGMPPEMTPTRSDSEPCFPPNECVFLGGHWCGVFVCLVGCFFDFSPLILGLQHLWFKYGKDRTGEHGCPWFLDMARGWFSSWAMFSILWLWETHGEASRKMERDVLVTVHFLYQRNFSWTTETQSRGRIISTTFGFIVN